MPLLKPILLILLVLQLHFVFAQSKNMHEAGRPIFVISNDLAQYAIRHVQFNGEFISKKRGFGFNFYFNKGLSNLKDPATYKRKEATMNPVTNGDGFYKSNYVGFDAKIYPHIESKKVKYFYAFGLEWGETSCRIEKQNTLTIMPGYWIGTTYYYYSLSSNTTKTVSYFTDSFWGLYHKHGCVWTITKWLYLTGEFNVGFSRFVDPDSNKDDKGRKQRNSAIKYGAGLHLGVAF